jgi:hypothetical protein
LSPTMSLSSKAETGKVLMPLSERERKIRSGFTSVVTLLQLNTNLQFVWKA